MLPQKMIMKNKIHTTRMDELSRMEARVNALEEAIRRLLKASTKAKAEGPQSGLPQAVAQS